MKGEKTWGMKYAEGQSTDCWWANVRGAEQAEAVWMESQCLCLCFQRSDIKQLEGEVFRDYGQYPGHRKTTILITNRYRASDPSETSSNNVSMLFHCSFLGCVCVEESCVWRRLTLWVTLTKSGSVCLTTSIVLRPCLDLIWRSTARYHNTPATHLRSNSALFHATRAAHTLTH